MAQRGLFMLFLILLTVDIDFYCSPLNFTKVEIATVIWDKKGKFLWLFQLDNILKVIRIKMHSSFLHKLKA